MREFRLYCKLLYDVLEEGAICLTVKHDERKTMKGKKSKTRTVGLRVTKEQEEILAEIQAKAELSKTDILLKGLDLLAQYYRLEEEQGPMEIGLRQLEQDALHHMESLKRIRRKQEAIQEFVSEIRFADEIIDTYGCDKSMLIQILLEVQKKKNGRPAPLPEFASTHPVATSIRDLILSCSFPTADRWAMGGRRQALRPAHRRHVFCEVSSGIWPSAGVASGTARHASANIGLFIALGSASFS